MSELGFALLLFFAAHAVGDVVLQPSHVSGAKRPGGSRVVPWFVAIGYHSIIHGALVALIVHTMTGNAAAAFWLGWAEVGVHAAIDTLKAHRILNAALDQLLHLAAKMVWAMVAIGSIG